MNICINVPSIVYQNSWISQTTDILATNIFSLPSNGIYRMTLGGTCSVISGPPYNYVEVSPVAITSVTAASVNPALSGSGTETVYACSEISFYGTSGEEVSFQVNVGGSGTFSADIYLTIEQVQ